MSYTVQSEHQVVCALGWELENVGAAASTPEPG